MLSQSAILEISSSGRPWAYMEGLFCGLCTVALRIMGKGRIGYCVDPGAAVLEYGIDLPVFRQWPGRILTRSVRPVVRGAEASVRVPTTGHCLLCRSRTAGMAATPSRGELAIGQPGSKPRGLAARFVLYWLPIIFTAIRLRTRGLQS